MRKEESVVILKKHGHAFNCSLAPGKGDESNSVFLGEELRKNIIKSLDAVKKHPFLNKVDIFIPRITEFNDLYLETAFDNLISTYSKRFLKKRVFIHADTESLTKKIYLMIFGKWQNKKKKILKREERK